MLKELSHRSVFQLSLAMLFIALIVIGVARDDVQTVISNATILCFSCIGLK